MKDGILCTFVAFDVVFLFSMMENTISESLKELRKRRKIGPEKKTTIHVPWFTLLPLPYSNLPFPPPSNRS